MVIKALSAMYFQLNKMLAAAALNLGYGLKQWEWPDSKPLSELEKMCPVLPESDWWEMQMGQMMVPQPHEWVNLERYQKILTSEGGPRSDLHEVSEEP